MSVRSVTEGMLQGEGEGVERNADDKVSQSKIAMIIYVIGRWREGE